MFDPSLLIGIPAVVKIVDWYRQAFVFKDFQAAATTFGAWVCGTAVVYLVHFSSFDYTVGGFADAVLMGVALGASGSLTFDGLKAVGLRVETGHTDHVPVVVVSGDNQTIMRSDQFDANITETTITGL